MQLADFGCSRANSGHSHAGAESGAEGGDAHGAAEGDMEGMGGMSGEADAMGMFKFSWAVAPGQM